MRKIPSLSFCSRWQLQSERKDCSAAGRKISVALFSTISCTFWRKESRLDIHRCLYGVLLWQCQQVNNNVNHQRNGISQSVWHSMLFKIYRSAVLNARASKQSPRHNLSGGIQFNIIPIVSANVTSSSSISKMSKYQISTIVGILTLVFGIVQSYTTEKYSLLMPNVKPNSVSS